MESLLELPEQAEEFIHDWDADSEPQLDSMPESVLVSAASIAAGVATRRGLKACWKKLRGSDPPIDPAASDVTWLDALTWAVAVGATVGVARVLSRRGAGAAASKFARRR